jgi:hypothetical protein
VDTAVEKGMKETRVVLEPAIDERTRCILANLSRELA